MSKPFSPAKGLHGEVLQGSTPKKSAPQSEALYSPANGLLLRGVVLDTYVFDSVHTSTRADSGLTTAGIYCDVFVYSGLPRNKSQILTNCLVTQDRTGMHDGDIWKPRPATRTTSGEALKKGASNPMQLDGDHVLIGFLDNNLALPVILRSIPHPLADVGALLPSTPGQHLKLSEVDDFPRLWRHQGAWWGVDADGNFIIDTSRAYGPLGVFGADGSEPAPLNNGLSGDVNFVIPTKSDFVVALGSNKRFVVFEVDDKSRLETRFVDIGRDATHPLVLGDTYTDARKPMHTSIAGALNEIGFFITAAQNSIDALASALSAVAAKITPPIDSATSGLVLTAAGLAGISQTQANIASGFCTGAKGSLDNFEANSANYLSADVLTR